jgi:SAM-dependent methyltransferase
MASKNILKDGKYLEFTYPKRDSDYPSRLGRYLTKAFFTPQHMSPGILDIGCGDGEFLNVFSGLGYSPTGADISPIESQHKIHKVDLETDKLPIQDDTINFIFSKSVIEHMDNPLNLMSEAHRVLAPGGKGVIMTPSWEHNYWGPFYIDHTHITPFTRYSLGEALKMAGFEDVRVEYFYQLPFVWNNSLLSIIPKIISMLPIPFRPFKKSRLPNKINKLIRFSNEVMLVAYVRKQND